MIQKIALLLICFSFGLCRSQDNVAIDGRLKPYLDQFFTHCKQYKITYHEKLFKLKNIDIVDTLSISPKNSTLGMLTRDKSGKVENIVINYITLLDKEILKVVAFHEFAHYFLEYDKHICQDCNKIMAIVNSSYFKIAKDWDNQVRILFQNSPILQKKTLAFTSKTKKKTHRHPVH